MNKNTNFAIPGMYENFITNKVFIYLMKNFPEAFYENVTIDAVFGNFQFCIWDGGRIFSSYSHATKEEIEKIIDFFNEKNNIPIRFIYTNTEIQKEHLSNRFCNFVTELCENELNEIVVNSPILEDYLRDKYPKYKFISSTTKCLKKPEDASKELAKEYYLVCLDYNLNHNLNYLNNLTEQEKEKVEFLVNPICGANCLNRKKHYKLNSLYSLSYGKPYQLDFCNIETNTLYPLPPEKRNTLSIQDIFEYTKKGFSHYKIEGRTFTNYEYLNNLIMYFVKPEYQLFISSIGFNYINKEKDNV